MHQFCGPILVPQPAGVNSPAVRRRRYGKPLHVTGTRGRYWILTDPDGRRWLFCERKSAAAGRSQLLRLPEPSWAIAEAALAYVARERGVVGCRILDVTTGTVYEATREILEAHGERIQHAGQEPQRRLPLRLWTTYPARPAKPHASEQLPLLAGEPVR